VESRAFSLVLQLRDTDENISAQTRLVSAL
jgi:hypothetical protein